MKVVILTGGLGTRLAEETETCPKPLAEIDEKLINGEFMTFKHKVIWKYMDTLRVKSQLNNMWNSGNDAWKVWDNEQA